ncbi:tetratricopeptide repeat protein [Flavobacterium lindanitolerans]|uniref:tetratricopeptide repeat protein n=1 Tax=Flavobacterium lindanitolerans TaxID=428988 RepID=UPI0031D2E786
MKNIIKLLILLPVLSYSQNKEEAERKVFEGVSLYDEGRYKEALLLYEEALRLDKNNLLALSEKALTLNTTKQYSEAVETCKLAINTHPKEDLKNVYVSYANTLDHLGQIENSLKIYDEGLAKYPNYYQLHFNKGITLINAQQVEKAHISFQNATKSNPKHSSSFNALGIINKNDNRIPSVLAFSRFLALENKSSRAKANYEMIIALMMQGVTEKEDNSISLIINPNTIEKKEKADNDFSSTDLILSMAAALDYDSKNKDKTQCQKFIDKFETLCASLDELKKKKKGYYWEFLVPYFIEMKKQKLIEPFAYIVFLPSQDKDVLKFHQDQASKIQQFYDWSNNYKWE